MNKQGVVSKEVVEENPRPEEFNYVEALIFQAERWEGYKLGVYDLEKRKVYFCTKKMKMKILENAAKEILKEKDPFDDLLPVKGPQSIFLEKLGYYTYPTVCSHQYAVYSDSKRKRRKGEPPLTAILCNAGGRIGQCQSLSCQRGRYFCTKHLVTVTLFKQNPVYHYVCLDCLFGFYLQAFFKYVHGAQVTPYNGIMIPDLDCETLDVLLTGTVDMIFDNTFALSKNVREEQRSLLSTYEKQYVTTLTKLDCKRFKEVKNQEKQLMERISLKS